MSDPSNVATGAFTLAQICKSVVKYLTKLQVDAPEVKESLSGVSSEINCLILTLDSVYITCKAIRGEQGSDQIGSLWESVARCIEDVGEAIQRIGPCIQEVEQDTCSSSRHDRFEEPIRSFRMQVHSSRTGLQLALQTISLWHQTKKQTKADQVLSSLYVLHDDVRCIARHLDERIDTLQSMFRAQQDESGFDAMTVSRGHSRSVASATSSASSIVVLTPMEEEEQDVVTLDCGDFLQVTKTAAAGGLGNKEKGLANAFESLIDGARQCGISTTESVAHVTGMEQDGVTEDHKVAPKTMEKTLAALTSGPERAEAAAHTDASQLGPFKSFRVSIDDPCNVVLRQDWHDYALYIVTDDQERYLTAEERPLVLFKRLEKEGKSPVFMLRHHVPSSNRPKPSESKENSTPTPATAERSTDSEGTQQD